MTSLSDVLARRWKWPAAAAGVVVLIVLPQVLANAYYVQLSILILLNAVLAMTFVLLLRAGMISLAVAGFWGIGAYASGMLTVKTGMSFWLSVPLALLVAAGVALALGALICRYSGLGFIIPSLLFGLIVPLVFGTFSWFGGYVGLLGVFPADSISLPGGITLDFIAPESQYYLLLVLAAISVVVLLAFYAAWTGRTWRAIGYSSKLAESVGVNPFRYRLGAFVLGAVIAALMGAFFAQYQSNILPDTYGPMKTITVQVFAILGGVGFPIIGPLVGAALLTILPEALRSSGNWEPIVTGAVIILIVMFLPHGILGSVLPRLRRGSRRAEAVSAAEGAATGEAAVEDAPPAEAGP